MKLKAALGQLSFASAFTAVEIDALAATARLVAVAKHQEVAREGDPADALHAVVSGAVRVRKAGCDDIARTIGFLFAGDLLGVLHRARYAYTVQALIETRLLAFDYAAFECVCERHPRIQHDALVWASNEMTAAQDRLMVMRRETAAARVAALLAQLARRIGRLDGAGGCRLALPMRQGDLADYLGVRFETVNRMLSRLEQAGVLSRLGPTDLQIHDLRELRRLAEIEVYP